MPLHHAEREDHAEGEKAEAEDLQVIRRHTRGQQPHEGHEGREGDEEILVGIHGRLSFRIGRSSKRMRLAAPSRSSYWPERSAQRKPSRPIRPMSMAIGIR